MSVLESVRQASAPDLHTQFDDLLASVGKAEANWTFDDRLDLALRSRTAASRNRR
jgi:hypothetical protein